MKWKKDAFGLGHGKKKNGSTKDKKSPGSSSKRSNSSRDAAAVESPSPTTPRAPKSNGPGLGTVRVGILRSESAPICTPTPRAKRQLISDLLAADGGEGDEDEHEPTTASPALRSIISNKSSAGKSFDREVGNGDAFSSYNLEEKVAFACHLNRYLLGDPFLKHLLPLDSGGGDFFNKFHDGVLMCRLVCLAIPGSVADSKINVPVGTEPLGLYKATENLNVALRAAEAAGLQVVNIGAADIIEGRPASILGLSWQLIRVHLLAQINLKGCPDLIHLMEEGEVKEDFYQLPAEEILLRWFNHHLRWGGSERRVSNFGEDLSDGRCYITLMKELNDNFKGDESDWPDEDAKRAQFRRACLVISGAEGIGLAPLIRPRHINAKAQLYNIAFVAQLLNRRPRIHRESLHLDASVAMQSWYRMVTVMRRTTPLIRRRRRSASTLSRASRRWMRHRTRTRAAITLQAWQRGGVGRVAASARRFELALAANVKMAEKQRAAAALEASEAELEASRLEAVRLQEKAIELRERQEHETAAAAAAAAAAEATAAEAAAAEVAVKAAEAAEVAAAAAAAAAAGTVQKWWRGTRTRRTLNAVLLERRMASLSAEAERRRQEFLEANMKDSQVRQNVSRRTSASSSVRFSEDSPMAETVACSFPGEEAAAADKPVSWFDKVFKGISFAGGPSSADTSTRESKTTKRQEAAAAMVIQRWQRAHADSKTEGARAKQEAKDRRRAVGALHKAYSNKWRFEIAARKEARHEQKQREEEEEEARRSRGVNGRKGGLSGLWADLVRHVSWRSESDSDSDSGLFGKRRRGRLEAEKGDDEGDCCDEKGKDVLASEVEAWKLSYITKQVLGFSKAVNAQEARARLQSQLGTDDRSWTPPEESLTPGKVVAIVSVVLSVVYETALANAAAVGG